VLYLGNFKPHKNVETLVKAFKKIEKSHASYKLVLAGPLDENSRRIRDLVVDEELSERVVFTGTIRENDCPEAILTLADVFVFPTLYEGFGLPPLEAMACGTPVVTSNLTAVPEVVHDAGIMVDPLDVEQLGRTIADLLDHPDKRKLCAQKGLERARLFHEENTAGKIHQYLISHLEDFR
jgi:glycosyltransferase involved in cell wall biosynthesis